MDAKPEFHSDNFLRGGGDIWKNREGRHLYYIEKNKFFDNYYLNEIANVGYRLRRGNELHSLITEGMMDGCTVKKKNQNEIRHPNNEGRAKGTSYRVRVFRGKQRNTKKSSVVNQSL